MWTWVCRELLMLGEPFCVFGKQMALKYFWNSSNNLSQAVYHILTFAQSWNFLLNTQHGFFVVKQFRKEIQFNKFYISWPELLVLLWIIEKSINVETFAQTFLFLPYMENIDLFISNHLNLGFSVCLTLLLFLKMSFNLWLSDRESTPNNSAGIYNPRRGCPVLVFFLYEDSMFYIGKYLRKVRVSVYLGSSYNLPE